MTSGIEPWSIRPMHAARSQQVCPCSTEGIVAVGQGWGVNDLQRRFAADAMFDENLSYRGGRHSPGHVQGRPKHSITWNPARPSRGAAA